MSEEDEEQRKIDNEKVVAEITGFID